MDEKIIDLISEENEILRRQVIEAEGLLRACYSYVEFHFERSRAGTGYEAKRLMDAILKYIGE